MFLMSLSTVGFVLITILFAVFFLTAYAFRHSNQTSDKFLGTDCKLKYPVIGGHIGLIEFVLLTTLGAEFGFSGFYYIAIAVIIAQIIWIPYYTNDNNVTFAGLIKDHSNLTFSVIVSIFQIITYLGLICFSMILTARIFQSLLGWNFVNSVLGIVGFTLVYILVGGYRSVHINKLISYVVFLLTILLTIVFVGINNHGFGFISVNLQKLAQMQGNASNYYLGFNFNSRWISIVGMLVIGLVGLNILYNKVSLFKQVKLHFLNILLKIVVAFIIVSIGIVTIGTNSKSTTVAGKHIVTYQAQMGNGEIAYVVKAVNNESGTRNTVSGLLPPLIDDKTNLMESNAYNYVLSGIVTMQHYLPDNIKFIIVLSIMALFIASLSQYLVHSCRVMLKNIVEPLELFAQYGESGKLWLARLTMVFMVFISLVIAYFLTPSFNLFNYFYLFLIVFMVPLFIVLVLFSFL